MPDLASNLASRAAAPRREADAAAELRRRLELAAAPPVHSTTRAPSGPSFDALDQGAPVAVDAAGLRTGKATDNAGVDAVRGYLRGDRLVSATGDNPEFGRRGKELRLTPTTANSLARAAGATAIDTLIAPGVLAAKGLNAWGRLTTPKGTKRREDRALENLEKLTGEGVISEVESLARDEDLRDSRRRAELGREKHPYASTAGDVLGDAAAGALTAGAAKAASPALGRSLAQLGTRASQRGMAELPVTNKHLSDVQNFLNRDRAASSFYERYGYKETVAKYGKERADEIARTTDATQAALNAATKDVDNPTTVYRGAHLTPDEIAQMVETGTYKNPSIWSTATERARAEGFAKKAAEAGREPVLFRINERSAVSTDRIPESNTFEEAVIPKGREFAVGKAPKTEMVGGKPVRVIDLAERKRARSPGQTDRRAD